MAKNKSYDEEFKIILNIFPRNIDTISVIIGLLKKLNLCYNKNIFKLGSEKNE